jgi:hypothetical protein
MKLKAYQVPYSSIVGSSIGLTSEETGETIALLMLSVPNPKHDYKKISEPVLGKIVEFINKEGIDV